jgi:hypothetical protein
MVLIIKPGRHFQPIQNVTEEKAILQSPPPSEPPEDFVLIGETIEELVQKNRILSRHRKDEKVFTTERDDTPSVRDK